MVMDNFKEAVNKYIKGKMSADDLVAMIVVDEEVDQANQDEEYIPVHSPDSTAALYRHYFDLNEEKQAELDAAMARRFGK